MTKAEADVFDAAVAPIGALLFNAKNKRAVITALAGFAFAACREHGFDLIEIILQCQGAKPPRADA